MVRCINDTLKLLHPELVNVIRNYGYEVLTEVQRRSIPIILSGYDVLIVAPTGSGKTEAAIFPLISKILYNRDKHLPISIIYITPLRALNRDLMKRLLNICHDLGLSIQVRHGDTPQSLRKSLEKDPPYILVTTPETFQYLLIKPSLRDPLANVKWVVIDEFHELIASKRGAELIASLYRLELIAGRFQRIALSASISDIELAKNVLSHGRLVYDVVVPYVRDMDIKVITPFNNGSIVDRVQLVSSLMNEHKQVLIFTNTRDEAEYLGLKLRDLGNEVYVHHGSLSRDERETVEEELKRGLIKGVVATSSLELGIDVGSIDAVIQFSSPRQAVKLVQRVGRSMHRANLKAKGYVVTDASLDDILESLVISRRALNNNLEDLVVYECPLDVLAHQLVGLALQKGEVNIDFICDLFRRSYVFRNLSYDDLISLLNLLSELNLIKVVGDKVLPTNKGRIYYLTTTMIVDSPHYDVVDLASRNYIGHLDEEFVALELTQNATLVLAGRLWRVVSIDEESKKVYVEEVNNSECLIPSWVGETIPVDYKVAREVCSVRRLIALNHLPDIYRNLISDEALRYISELLLNHLSKGYPLPTENLVVIEVRKSSPSLIVIHSCLGSRGNRGLGYLVGYLITKFLGLNPSIKVDPYRVIIQLPIYVPSKNLEEIIKHIVHGDLDEVLRESLVKSTIYRHCLINVLKRLGIIPDNATLNIVNALARRFEDNEVIVKEVVNELTTKYVDLRAVKELVTKIKEGKTSIKFIDVSELSPLALEGLKAPSFTSRVLANYLPRNAIAELIRRRLMNKQVRLICLICGYNYVASLRDLPDVITCPRCGVRYVGVSKDLDEDVVKIILKGMKAGGKFKFVLSEEEKELFTRIKESAYLVLNYGKRAVIALTAYGIGPESAKKVLTARSDEEFYNLIYELERRYITTRRYWD